MPHSPLPSFASIALICGLVSSCSYDVEAAQYEIQSSAELSSLELMPGDEVIWLDGEYSTPQDISFHGEGTAEAPITLRAETPGGVVFTGAAPLHMMGRYLVLDGFHWKGGGGASNQVELRKSGGYTPSQMAQNCVIRNCVFDDLQTEGDNKSRWLVLYGRGHLVEHCSFLRKQSTGACVLVELSYLEGDADAGHMIRNNYFYDIPSKAERMNDGDSETIRVGSSDNEGHRGGVTVQRNYFVEASGEAEIVSDKSDGNQYLQNTFRRCEGALVLRSGKGAVVAGNYFFGEGVDHTGGIRISNINHRIQNNYFSSLRGDGLRAALAIYGGNVPSGSNGGSGVYAYVENLTVESNTFYDCTYNINFETKRYKANKKHPLSGNFINNLVYSASGEPLVYGGEGDSFQPGNLDWSGNIFYGSPVGFVVDGIAEMDPVMMGQPDFSFPSREGPVADAAEPSPLGIDVDIDGRARGTLPDVGAHEVTASGMPMTYLTDADIGGEVGAPWLSSLK